MAETTPAPIRALIINADDFGYNDAITQGIIAAYRTGIVTSTSAMVNLPGAPARIAAAHAAEPRLPIGLHLNLTIGRPVLPPSQIPNLVTADGRFLPHEELLPRLPSIPLEQIRAELNAQASLLNECGLAFDHIDCHQHFVAFSKPIFGLIAELAVEYSVPVRQPAMKAMPGDLNFSRLDGAGGKIGRAARGFLRQPKSLIAYAQQMDWMQAEKPIADRLGSTDWFISSFYGNPTLANLRSILQHLPAGSSEMVVHPALDAPEIHTMEEEYRTERLREFAVLTSPEARAEIVRQQVTLIDFSAVRIPGT
jgi:predicted glycoside hydrolase/deacetylase ChbG (UPF0249 family)